MPDKNDRLDCCANGSSTKTVRDKQLHKLLIHHYLWRFIEIAISPYAPTLRQIPKHVGALLFLP
jgi:hypothetical protein